VRVQAAGAVGPGIVTLCGRILRAGDSGAAFGCYVISAVSRSVVKPEWDETSLGGRDLGRCRLKTDSRTRAPHDRARTFWLDDRRQDGQARQRRAAPGSLRLATRMANS